MTIGFIGNFVGGDVIVLCAVMFMMLVGGAIVVGVILAVLQATRRNEDILARLKRVEEKLDKVAGAGDREGSGA